MAVGESGRMLLGVVDGLCDSLRWWVGRVLRSGNAHGCSIPQDQRVAVGVSGDAANAR